MITPASTGPTSTETKTEPEPEPKPSASPSTEPPPVQPDPPPIKQHSGSVELRLVMGHNSADIDNWHVGHSSDNDLVATDSELLTTGGATLAILEQGEPDQTICRGLHSRGIERVAYASLVNGSYLCARSSEGRTAWLKIEALPTDVYPAVKFYATTLDDAT